MKKHNYGFRMMAGFLIVLLLCTGCSRRQFETIQKLIREMDEAETADIRVIPQSEPVPAPPEIVRNYETPHVSADKYAYNVLDEDTKLVYDEIYQAMTEYSDTITVSTTDQRVLEKAYRAVTADYGELFWVDGYGYTEYKRGDTVVSLRFSPKYTMTQEDMQSFKKQVEEKVSRILEGISIVDSDFNKAKYVYDTLIRTVEYDTSSPNNQNILSVFLEGKTVCQGYACATQYLLKQLGITGAVIGGTADGVPHAWNLVLLDGDYYYMDTTWGSSSYRGEEATYINYAYFALTSEEMAQTHKAEETFLLPVCDSRKDNYFVHENLYFSEWNPDELGSLFAGIGEQAVAVRFSDDALYRQAYQYFMEDGHIWDYYSGEDRLYYLLDDELQVLTIMTQ